MKYLSEDPDTGARLIIRTADIKNHGWSAGLSAIAWVMDNYGFTLTDADRTVMYDYTDAYHRFDDTAETHEAAMQELVDRALTHASAAEPGWAFRWEEADLYAEPTG